jgi:stearoyl-CoA 9-desaturase NADPH oxidoreductase
LQPALRLAARLARPFALERQIAFWLGELDPTWTLGEIRARVEAVVDETADTKTFVLRPNGHWAGHRAGQHTTVEVEIEGVRARRCYSLSSAPAAGRPAITVKRKPGGLVSGWLHDRVGPGDVLRLGPAAGDFVLPDPPPGRLLLLGAGSGMTPLASMLRELAARDLVRDVVLVCHARSREDVIFGGELQALAARHRGLRLHLCLSDRSAGPGRFDEEQLRLLVPDLAERETFLCGPPGLTARVERLWADAGASGRLRRERFVAAVPEVRPGGDVRITLAGTGRSFVAAGAGTLLEQLERAGERPRSGCRMGICQTCKVRKRSGAVEDLRTGAISSAPDEDIQPCVSVARSDVEVMP